MNVLTITVFINTILTFLLLSIYDGIMLRRTIKNNSFDESTKYPPKDESYDDELTTSSYELERIARENDFDKRIERLKQELEYENKSTGTPAEILDPNIYNIPHDSITHLINPDVDEISI